MRGSKSNEIPCNQKCVYVLLSDEGPVKIGVSREVKRRKQTIETTAGIIAADFFFTAPLSNYGIIESRCHKHFNEKRKRGEWFNIPYEEAVAYVNGLVKSIGESEKPPPLNDTLEQLFRLPTAMEEFMHDDPEIYNWMTEQGHEAYWTNGSEELRVKGEGFDILFVTYAAETTNRSKH